MATERSLERCGIDSFDLLLLHNPDRIGYTSETVWEAMATLRDAGLTRLIGVAPGPANGFTLDLIDCLERFGALLDWAMIILNPLEPWPGELCLDAAAAARVQVITRVVDYGGLFFDDLVPGQELVRQDHRSFRPAGWIEQGRERLEHDATGGRARRPHDDPARLPVEPGARAGGLRRADADPGDRRHARPVESKRAELAALPAELRLTAEDVDDDPRDRRQHRLHGAQGREPRALRRGAARPLGPRRSPRGGRRTLGDRSRAPARQGGGVALTL